MKLSLTYDDIHGMVREAVSRVADGRSLINEISSKDAYERFYRGKIAPDAYEELMKGTANMTPYHKLCLDRIVARWKTADENWRENKPYAIFVARAAKVWNDASLEARQIIVRLCKEDYDFFFKKGGEMFSYLERYSKMKYKTAREYEDGGLVVLFESPAVRITCTTTYSSSCHFFGKSHWCTASDRMGNYDGFDYFKQYTEVGPLIQFYNKENEFNSYQVNFNIETMLPESICDWMDSRADYYAVGHMLRDKGLNDQEVMNKYVFPRLEELYNETKENLRNETVYYKIANRKRALAFCKAVDGVTRSKKAQQFALDIANGAADGYNEDETLYGWESVDYNDETKVVIVRFPDRNPNWEHHRAADEFRSGNYSFYNNYGVIPNLQTLYFIKDGKILNAVDGHFYKVYGRVVLTTKINGTSLGYDKLIDIETGKVLFENFYGLYIPSDTYWLIRQTDYAKEMAEKLGTNSDREWIAFRNPNNTESIVFINTRTLKTFVTDLDVRAIESLADNDLPY